MDQDRLSALKRFQASRQTSAPRKPSFAEMTTKTEPVDFDAAYGPKYTDTPEYKTRLKAYNDQVSAVRYSFSLTSLVILSIFIVILGIVVWALTTFDYFVVEHTPVVIAAVSLVLPLIAFIVFNLVNYMKYLGWAIAAAYTVIAVFLALYGLDNLLNTLVAGAELASTVTRYDATVYLSSAAFEILLLVSSVAVVYSLVFIVYKLSELEREAHEFALRGKLNFE